MVIDFFTLVAIKSLNRFSIKCVNLRSIADQISCLIEYGKIRVVFGIFFFFFFLWMTGFSCYHTIHLE